MSTHPAFAIQAKIYEILCADATLCAFLSSGADSIFDSVKEESGAPYVTIGDDEFSDWSSHTFEGVEADLTIKTWTQKRGRKTCKQIMSRIYELLHDVDLSISGYSTVSMRCVFLHTVVDSDNITILGVQRFKLLLGGI